MRKLKLQMQVTIDGFVCGPNGELDWTVWNWDDALKAYVREITDTVDCIVMGRKLADGFIPYWANAVNDAQNPDHDFAYIMDDTPKVVYTNTLQESPWENTSLIHGDLKGEIVNLKNQQGNDIIVYGGSQFVSSLVNLGLIDEFNIFINPAAIGVGMSIFKERTNLKLDKATAFECGIVAIRYLL